MANRTERTLSVHQEHELLLAFERAGISPADADRVITSKNDVMATQVLSLIRGEYLGKLFGDKWVTVDEAAEMIGPNFRGIDVVERHLFGEGAGFSPDDRLALETTTFPMELILANAQTHILQAVAPMSLLQVHAGSSNELFWSAQRESPWFGDDAQAFARTVPEAGWALVRVEEKPGSTSKSRDEQLELLDDDEYNPSVAVMAQVMAVHFRQTHERLFEKLYVRCNDVASSGFRVSVGGFHDGGFGVSDYSDGDRYSGLGIASARKFS